MIWQQTKNQAKIEALRWTTPTIQTKIQKRGWLVVRILKNQHRLATLWKIMVVRLFKVII